MNTFTYVGDNPLNRIDPTGKSTIVVVVAVAAAVISVLIAKDIICKCEKKYPNYRYIESSDRNNFFQCIGIIVPFLRLTSVATDPVVRGASEVGATVGEHICESCEN